MSANLSRRSWFVILGLVPKTQPSIDVSASGWMDGRAKPDHDIGHQLLRSE